MSQLFNVDVLDKKVFKEEGFIRFWCKEIIPVSENGRKSARVQYGVYFGDLSDENVTGFDNLTLSKLVSDSPFYETQQPSNDGLYYQSRFYNSRVEAVKVDMDEYKAAAALRKAERAARREKSFTGTEGLPQ